MLLQRLLREELARRKARNQRYSLRAFARDLAVHHSTLSRVMRGRQRVTAMTLATLAAKLRLQSEEIRESALSGADHAVLGALDRDDFRPESRWIATVTGLPVDVVNGALQRLLRKGLLRMESAGAWSTDSRTGR